MRPENQARLRKIERISGALRVICKLVLSFYVLVVLVMVWGMLGGKGHDFMGGNYVNFHIHELTVRDRLIVGGLWAATGGVMFKAVYHLHQLLGNYSRGAIFTKESAWQIRQWGFACVLWGVIKFLWLGVPYVVSAVHRVPGAAEFGGLGMVLNGLIIVAISWFMEMAAEMREENELTV
jgi:Protein of unknown function (DUF2975)